MNHVFEDPANRVGYLLWQSAHLVSRAMTEALEPLQLTPAQFGALVHTGREPGLSAAELARRLNLTPQSVQTALLPLLQQSWLERRRHPVHKRVLGLFLTGEGIAHARLADHAIQAADVRLTDGFNKAQQEELRNLLKDVMTNVNPNALDRSSLRSPDR